MVEKNLTVRSSPHLHSGESTKMIMLDVLIALPRLYRGGVAVRLACRGAHCGVRGVLHGE